MRRFFTSVAKRFVYLVALLVVIAAVIVLAARIITPYLDARRPQIETWASDLLHTPITIEGARVAWHIYEPGVALQNVTILDDDDKTPILQLRSVKVFFSIPQSLIQRKLVYSGVMISGAEIIVHQDKQHGFTVQGFPQFSDDNEQPYAAESRAKEVLGFLFSQPELILRNIDVRYTGIKGLKRYITLYNLKMKNAGDAHQIAGKAILHQAIPTELSVAATFTGNEPDLAKIQGKIYLNLSGFALNQWLKGLEWYDWRLDKGLLGAKIWATWGNGGLNRIQTSFQLYDVELYSSVDKTSHKVNRLSGDVGWKKEGQDQVIAGNDLLIDWSDKLWPVTSFYLKMSPDQSGKMRPVTMNVGYLDIADTYSILTSFAKIIPQGLDAYIGLTGINGNLENVHVSFMADKNPFIPESVTGDFGHLDIKSWQHLPGFSNLAGSFRWQRGKGSIELRSSQPEILYTDIFNQPINLENLVGKVDWQWDGEAINIVMRDFSVMNQDIAMNVHGNITVPASHKPEVDLNANFTLNHARNVTKYLPQKIFSKELNQWLDQAFLSGDVQSGSILLRGPLNAFPFDKGDGQFIISGAVNNVQLHYAPEWPDLSGISGTVKFSGNQVIIDVNHAQLLGVSIPQTHAEIPNLNDKNARLNVSGKPIQADFKYALEFIQKSPLNDSIGRMFRQAELSGPMELNLTLGIPLARPEQTSVNGVIDIRNGQIALKPWRVDIRNLQGKVDFTQSSVRASAIQGELFGKSLQLNIQTINENKPESVIRLTVDNVFDLADLQAWLGVPLDKVASGSARAQTRIDIANDQPLIIKLSSNLLGVTLNLPEQYAKPENEQRQFNAEVIIGEGSPLKVKLTYADLLRVAMVMQQQHDALSLHAVNLHLGDGNAGWPDGDGLFITGKLKQLSWKQISQYAGSTSDQDMHLPLKSVDLSVDSLDLLGVDLGKTELGLDATEAGWHLDIDSAKVAGKIDLPKQLAANGKVSAKLEYINLDALADIEKSNNKFDVSKLPAIDFSADEVEYYGVPFHAVKLVTAPMKGGMNIERISSDGRAFKFHAKGTWLQDHANNATTLKGNATVANVSELLDDMEFDTHNFIAGKGVFDFDLAWKNPPYQLSLQTIDGTASVDIGKGRIIEISGASDAQMDLGRMLNVFSLQTIPRRLSLDFSDMFEKGYSFDYLRGDYKFANGSVHTGNMRFDGPVAKVSIKGKIGLVDEDFDLKLSVTPYVTSSIPIAATLLTGQPVIGVAALIVNKILSSEVSKATTYSYEVNGPWSDPQWKKIKEKKA